MKKIIRTSTVPSSLNTFCKGLLKELIDDGYDVVAVSSPGAALDEVRQREGVKTYAVAMERRFSPLKDMKSLWGLIKVFKKERPDMVHSITPKAGLLSMLAAWICRVPVRLHTFTGLVFPTSSGIKRKILIATDKLTCACATHIIPEGDGVKSDLQKFKITNKPLKVLGYGNIKGIDLEKFNPNLPDIKKVATKIRKPDVFTFLFIGRLVKDKGIHELISAFRELQKNNSNVRLLLVGRFESNIDPLNDNTIFEIQHNPAIEAVGEQKDVRPWLLAADCFVFPSYREGFPNVVIEAGAMGLPSIVTDINGSREIIIDGKNGLVIPPQDPESLRKAMELVINDNCLVDRLKAECRALIASRYEQGFVRQCLKDYYKNILNE